jgi:hypothetical protein
MRGVNYFDPRRAPAPVPHRFRQPRSGPTRMLEYCGKHGEDAVEWINMKTKLTQRRFKAQKSSACGLCKPWKKGGEDKKTVGQLRKAQDADQQLKEV